MITAAQQIRPYTAPEYLVQPVGEPSDSDDLQSLNDLEGDYLSLDRRILGWGTHNAIIAIPSTDVTTSPTYYLVTIK
jgi:hypothetical protein